jgi:hypothetical protein
MNDPNYHALEELLTEAAPQADAKFYMELRQKVLRTVEVEAPAPKRKFPPFSRVRLWQPVAVGALLLIAILFLTPIGQTIAQQVLRLGVFFVTNNPSLAEQSITDPPSEEEIYTVETLSVAPDEAGELAGFTVHYPTYLPPGYRPESDPPVELSLDTQGKISSAEAMFLSADGEYILFYAQHPFPPDNTLDSMPLDAGTALVEPTTVQGNEALWLANYVWGSERDAAGVLQPVEYNVLIWTLPAANGAKFYFWLGSEEKLPQSEMLRIADSMVAE